FRDVPQILELQNLGYVPESSNLPSSPPQHHSQYGKNDRGVPRLLTWLLILVSGSGFAALVYEIVWLQQLQLVIGSSAISLGLLLATYMGGLFVGSIAVPRMISSKRHPLWLYGVIEFGIGIFGLLILFGLPLLRSIYV